MKTTFKHLFLGFLVLCLLITNCNVYGLEPDTKDTAVDSAITIPAYVSDGSGQVKYGNRNDYILYNNGSFVLYLSHANAITYANNLNSSYAKGLASDVWAFVGFVAGVVAGCYVAVKSADLKISTLVSSGISSALSTLGTWLAQKTAGQRIAWMNTLYNQVTDALMKCDSNVGIYVSFNANNGNHYVGIQTY